MSIKDEKMTSVITFTPDVDELSENSMNQSNWFNGSVSSVEPMTNA